MMLDCGRFCRMHAVLVAAIAALGLANPAHAGFGDTVLDLVREKGHLVGINRDSVELTLYAIHHPAYASELLARAAAQDLPLFAMIAAVKAAKNRKLPTVGVFTEAKCLTPITVIDAVFAEADGYIDDAEAKADTNAATGAAAGYAADYGKATTAEAKADVMAKLAEEVPYFGDIPMICNFAFETELETERNVQTIFTKTVTDLKAAYTHFQNEEYVKGAKRLIAMGVDEEFACGLVDDALDAAGVGIVPGVDQLSSTVCKGFSGKVVGTIVDGAGAVIDKGAELAEDGAELVAEGGCAVLDLFGACNPDIPAPPPSGLKNAKAFCSGNGGLATYQSPGDAPDDFSVVCENGAMCSVKPGVPAVCVTADQHAAFEAERSKANRKTVAAFIANYPKQFDTEFILPCPDKKCEVAEKVVLSAIIPKMKAIAAADPSLDPGEIEAHSDISPLRQQARNILKTAKAEFAAATEEAAADATAKAAAAYESLQIAKWSKQCPTEACRDGVVAIAAEMRKQMIAYQKQHPELGSAAVTGTIGKKYAKVFQQLIDSAEKAESEDAAADTTEDAAAAYETLQIAKWSKQCPSEACRDGVVAIAAEMRKQMIAYQKQHPELGSAAVTGTIGKKYAKIFQQLIDSAEKDAAEASAADASPAKTGLDGCKAFLGRKGQWLCPDQAGFRACIAEVKGGKAQLCATGDLLFAKAPMVSRMLRSQGCVQQGDGLDFACPSGNGMATCEKFKSGRTPVRCTEASG